MARSRHDILTVSVRLLHPFQRLLASYEVLEGEAPLIAPELLEHMRLLGPDARLPLEVADAALAAAVHRTRDPDLGLKAGRLFDMEDGGALAYAAGSAATLREAMATAARCSRLLSNAVSYRVVHRGTRTEVHLESKAPLPRASADFQASALRSQHRRTHAFDIPSIEWSFTHARPASVDEYVRTFGNVPLHFAAPYLGFSIDACYLDLPLRTADARQHQFVMRQIDVALADMAAPEAVLRCVREVIARHLGEPQLDVEHVANSLRMSPRTLARRLHEEGTSFRDLVSAARKDRALHYLSTTDRAIAEIASSLGFSDVAAFYRAFRRWMRTTPVAFRAEARARTLATSA